MSLFRNSRLLARAAALAVALVLLAPGAAHAQLPSIGAGSPWVLAPYSIPAVR